MLGGGSGQRSRRRTVDEAPRIGNREPVPFKLLRISETEVVFENPTHDFPQRIIYRKRDPGLWARIEAGEPGKVRGNNIPMKKASCE